MFLNSWPLRLGLIGAGVLLGVAWMLWGGSLVPGSDCKVLVEFGSDPDTFAGMEVVSDGKVLGRLESIGQATHTAFPVACGTHEVAVRHPGFDSSPIEVAAEIPGFSTMLQLEHGEVPGPGGHPALTLHP